MRSVRNLAFMDEKSSAVVVLPDSILKELLLLQPLSITWLPLFRLPIPIHVRDRTPAKILVFPIPAMPMPANQELLIPVISSNSTLILARTPVSSSNNILTLAKIPASSSLILARIPVFSSSSILTLVKILACSSLILARILVSSSNSIQILARIPVFNNHSNSTEVNLRWMPMLRLTKRGWPTIGRTSVTQPSNKLLPVSPLIRVLFVNLLALPLMASSSKH